MKKIILASVAALALIGSSFAYAQSFDMTTSVISSSVNTTTDIVDSVSLGCKPLSRFLSIGDGNRNARSEEVKNLQTILIQKGHMSGSATGYFGLQTLKAVKMFQVKEGVSSTGYVGPITLERIKASCGIGPIAICDYAAPPSGCNYVAGPDYNSRTQCGMVLSCAGTDPYTPPANCSSWYDGCNTCSRITPGGKVFCTLRACISPSDGAPVTTVAKCNTYFGAESTCSALGKTYIEGQSTSCIGSVNSKTKCIADASYTCRNGIWKIEGGYPYIKEPPAYCTMEARLCANGNMMPRDNNCSWLPQQCSAY